MRIEKTLAESFKSPFVNLLAIANLVLVTFSSSASLPFLISTPLSKLAILMNLPAFLAARLVVSRTIDAFAFIPPFIYLQWILIGVFAKLIASHWKPKAD